VQAEVTRWKNDALKNKQEVVKVVKERDEDRRLLGDVQTKLKIATEAAAKRSDKAEKDMQMRAQQQKAQEDERVAAERKRAKTEAAALRAELQEALRSRAALQAETERLSAALAESEGRYAQAQATARKFAEPKPVSDGRNNHQPPQQPAPLKQDDDFKAFFKYIAKHPVPTK
jgi:hypothetical protein